MPTISDPVPPVTEARHPPVSSSQDRRSNPHVEKATAILAGATAAEAKELWSLLGTLKAARYFDLARQVAVHARRSPEVISDPEWSAKFAQQQALCTYKDPDLSADQRLDDALAILRNDLNLNSTAAQETLGLAGAIFKRKWEIDGQREQLERALAYYRRGFQQGVRGDNGYTGINAAFVLDLLATLEEEAAIALGIPPATQARRTEARQIREDIVKQLTGEVGQQRSSRKIENAWFLLGTLGEAEFGLGHYKEAEGWLVEALRSQPPVWEYETTGRQLAALARLQSRRDDGDKHQAWQTLQNFLGHDAVAANSVTIGKVGLSLSGGGFRASLFHIGVLARLAECDVLRHVEVLSCVSGGSIVGAHYYLEVKKLLRIKADREITRDDYVALVGRLEENFLRGVQRNIRCLLASEFLTSLKMAVTPDYTTSQRLGELYEEEIYRLVDDGENTSARWLNELIIQPKGERPDFTPKLDNWRRNAKVPILILNATTLNTGHNWQFTASWMGETPCGITTEIEANDRLRRLYYWQAPEGHKRMRLGHAVAASACVPALFEPLILPGIYPERVVHLVDGGLHDNQGVASLLEQDCAVFLVSDATGQMQTIRKPRSELHEVALRTTGILMARVREAEFRELHARRRASLIRGLMFLHLKKGLDVAPVDWIGAQTTRNRAGEAAVDPEEQTSYGVSKKVQEQLAAIRTDLDSFNDTEAFALMASGYLMTKRELPQAFSTITGLADVPTGSWRFLQVQNRLAGEEKPEEPHGHFARLLATGCSKFGKHFQLHLPGSLALSAIPLLVAVAAVAALCFAIGMLPKGLRIALALILAGAAVALVSWIVKLFRARQKSITQFVYGLLFALLGWIAWIHLFTTDRFYLWLGRVAPAGSGGPDKSAR